MHTAHNTTETHLLPTSAINSQVKFLQGKVLTIVDASYADGQQKDAVKSLINQAFSEQLNHIYDIAGPTGERDVQYQDTNLVK